MADPSGTGAQNMTNEAFEVASTGKLTLGWQFTAILIMTSGSVFLMWLGEQIDEYGIGNGISLLIMAGIVAMMPSALMSLLSNASFELRGFNSGIGLEKIIMLVMMFVGVVVGVVFRNPGTTSYSYAECETRSRQTRLRRHETVHAFAC